jgi:hypothetical protein
MMGTHVTDGRDLPALPEPALADHWLVMLWIFLLWPTSLDLGRAPSRVRNNDKANKVDREPPRVLRGMAGSSVRSFTAEEIAILPGAWHGDFQRRSCGNALETNALSPIPRYAYAS